MKHSAFSLWSGPANEAGMEVFPNGIPYTLPPGADLTDNQALTAAYLWHGAWQYTSGGQWVFRYGHSIPVYDDSWGKVFIHRDSNGINGIARAQSWEDAYGIVEDEFFPEADETVDEIKAEYNKTREHVKIVHIPGEPAERPATSADYTDNGKLPVGTFVRWETVETPAAEGEDVWTENELFQEAYGFRPNGPNARDVHGHGIYAKDLNGDYLDTLTWELRGRLEIFLTVENQYSDYAFTRWTTGDRSVQVNDLSEYSFN